MGILVDRIEAKGVRLWVQGEQIIASPKEIVSDGAAGFIRENRGALMIELRSLGRHAKRHLFQSPPTCRHKLNSSADFLSVECVKCGKQWKRGAP